MTFYQLKKLGGNVNPNCLEYLPLEDLLISVCGSLILIHNFSTGALLKTIEYHSARIVAISLIQSNPKLEIFSLDESGMIKCSDLKSESKAFIWGFHLRENIKDGLISKKLKRLFFTVNGKENGLFVFNFFDNEIFHLGSPEESKEKASKYHGLKSSKDERIAFEWTEKKVTLYNLQENKVVSSITHDNFVTAVDLSPDHSKLAVGDVIGKIYLYFDPLAPREAAPKSSKFHWHCKSVQTLWFNSISNVLLSGGYENVLVMWYYTESKKNFCPRLSSPILSVFVNQDETMYFLILADNSIEVIKSSNFLECAAFKFITNPLRESEEEIKVPYFQTGVVQHPTQNLSLMNGLPGEIQFINPLENKKVSSFKVIRRHLTTKVGEIDPDPLLVTHICLDSSGTVMATSVMRAKREKNQNSLCSLYFWEETKTLEYSLNTRIDNIHGENILGIISFKRSKENSEEFASFGSDKKLKLWRKAKKENANNVKENRRADLAEKSHETLSFYWGCYFETSFKDSQMTDVVYFHDKSKARELLCFTVKNGLVLMDLETLDFINVIEIQDSIPFSPFRLKSCETAQILILYDEKRLLLYSIDQERLLLQLDFLKLIDCLVFENFCYILEENESSEGRNVRVLLKISLDELLIVKTLFLTNEVNEIFMTTENDKYHLIGIDKEFTFLILETNSEPFQNESKQIREEHDLTNESPFNHLWTSTQKGGKANYDLNFHYFELINKIKLENSKMINLFHSHSHFIPKISLLYNNYMDRVLLKDLENGGMEEEKPESSFEIAHQNGISQEDRTLNGFEDQIKMEIEPNNPVNSDYIKQLNIYLNQESKKI